MPKFNRAICLENNTEIGNVDEIFGLFNAYVKLYSNYLYENIAIFSQNEGRISCEILLKGIEILYASL